MLGISNVSIDNRINLLSVFSSVFDGKLSTIGEVSYTQILTRNETVLQYSFIFSFLTKLGTSCVVEKSSMDSDYQFLVGSDSITGGSGQNTSIVISSGFENKNSLLN